MLKRGKGLCLLYFSLSISQYTANRDNTTNLPNQEGKLIRGKVKNISNLQKCGAELITSFPDFAPPVIWKNDQLKWKKKTDQNRACTAVVQNDNIRVKWNFVIVIYHQSEFIKVILGLLDDRWNWFPFLGVGDKLRKKLF